ncbi:hypothetical protein CO038_04495 [Candidatus Pacearchaeota archaeon CG_4_9_14_0_2_um_filter_39_13]|nr:DUF2238 domain-containing protein [Candidatus Pacearchaeota archaeon]OIO42582.1 MAG: hypothetical protein AUJ64_03815 [Candidatus Pacearchaeota archaeon CG1_02_39_14]PJC44328.1 MAG: hypothetical protein CO038_04495 [Candidatus Pacearchaeota archaeon CG_4_9_14_0_2_um_filter_39_13]
MKKGEWLLTLFNLAYIIGFTIYYYSIKDYEFLGYIAVLVVLFLVVAGTLRKTNFGYGILWALTAWGLLHMLGGGLIINGSTLYALQLIPLWVTENFYVLKMDQVIHFYLYFVMVFVIWHLLKGNIKKKHWLVYVAVALVSIGISGLNEVAEFIMVLSLENTGVGGYYNTAWDIVFNTLGAVAAGIIVYFRER